MKRVMTALLAAMLAAGCGAYVDKKVRVEVYNSSNDNIVVTVDAGEGHSVAANNWTRFEVKVGIPTNPANSYGGPSAIDKTVRVNVAIRNARTGELTYPEPCYAGAKKSLTIWYEVSFGRFGARCD